MPAWRLTLAVHASLRTVVACVICAWCGCAFALDPTLDVTQYAHTAWKVRDGFLKAEVLSFAQTPDGYLWLGTPFGLLRFDGVRAIPWEPPAGASLPGENIFVLRVTGDGTLWIGTDRGLASWNGNSLRVHPAFQGEYIMSIVEDRQGTLWVGGQHVATSTGFLCTIRGATTECQSGRETLGIGITSVYEDGGGALWIATTNQVRRWRPEPPKLFSLATSIPTIAETLTEFQGKILVATVDGVQQIVDERVEPFPVPVDPSRIPVALFRDRDRALWIGTLAAGVLHVRDGRVDTFAPLDGLSGVNVHTIFEDREGSVWLATEGGIDRFRAPAVVPQSIPQGAAAAVLADRGGSIWIATLTGLYESRAEKIVVYRGHPMKAGSNDSSGSVRRETVDERVIVGMPDVTTATLFEDREGRIWIGSQSGVGYLDHGRYFRVTGVGDGYIDSIVEDTMGKIWIAHRKVGLLRWSQDRKLERFAWPIDSGGAWAYRVALDPVRGGVWVGSYVGGVVHVVDGSVRAKYSTDAGLGKGSVGDVHVMNDGTVWAATEGGLSRIKDGRVATLNTSAGLPCDAVHWLIDDDGATWLHTSCGLLRIAHSDLNDWTAAIDQGKPPRAVPSTLFDSSDGFVADKSSGSFTPHVTKSADGKLWFTTTDGVAVVDPHHLPYNKVPPPVQVEQVVADRKGYAFSTALSLPPLVRDLEIQYTALSFVAPEKVQFKYKLEGRDREWRDAGNRRRANYTDLPPGDYRFRVIACNNSGVWNEQGATLDFSIEPAYWQTNWFRALVLLALLALAYTVYRLRVAQLARHFNATLDARVNERTRIARDLHDTLLQSFHGLLLRFQTARALLPANATKAAEVLDSAIDQAAGAITEGRDAVQGLRTSATEMNDLAESIRALGEELATANGNSVVLRVDVQGASRPLHPIVRDEVFRIASEALRNAFKHAGAEQIEVEMHYDERQMRLRVRDDGKGIPQELLRAEGREGHFGLHGMRERAKLAGGKLVIWSGPDAGTEVELSIPASHAYSKASRPRSWLAEKVMGQGHSSDS